jgi:hypothetical protein
MLFAIDIDRTIAGGFKAYVEHHNQELELGIPPHVLDALTDYQSFLHLPEVIAFRSIHEARFQDSRASCRVSPQVIRSLEEIPGAVVGVTYLSHFGTIRYYTIRSHEVQEGTREWLSTKRFPNPHDVVFCESSLQKLSTLYHQETQEAIVLIDDKCESLLRAFEKFAKGSPLIADDLQQRLVLVAFGVEVQTLAADCKGLKVLALPSWDAVADVIAPLCLNAENTRWSSSPSSNSKERE